MPWTVEDVDKHHKNLTVKQKRMWVVVANRAKASGNDDATAITKASGAVNKVAEAAAVIDESMGGDLIEAASRALIMDDSHSGIRNKLYDVLNTCERYYAYIEDIFGDANKGTLVYSSNKSYWKRSYTKNNDSYILGDATRVVRAYNPAPIAESEIIIPEGEPLTESEITVESIKLVEKAVNRDGTIQVKLIAPGHGTSGYYPADVIKRDGPKVFTEGTKMFWDHDTDEEERSRPEGSLNRLAAVLTEDAKFDEAHPEGPGLYARAKVFNQFKDALNDLAPHIGVSIRAFGEAANGQVGGKATKIIRSIKGRKSVDFVTSPGAGGRVLQLFEAARSRDTNQESNAMTKEELEQFQESQKQVANLATQVKRLQEAATLREGADFVRAQILIQGRNLPQISKDRLLESAGSAIITKDGAFDKDATTAAVKTLVESEVKYVASLLKSGSVVNLGESAAPDADPKPEELDSALTESFKSMGYEGDTLKTVAKGRE